MHISVIIEDKPPPSGGLSVRYMDYRIISWNYYHLMIIKRSKDGNEGN